MSIWYRCFHLYWLLVGSHGNDIRASDTGQFLFDNVRVPKRYRVGEENRGFTMQIMQFQEERMYAAAGCSYTLL
jgi:alkylation response protein AidB-like acyl-CoA dehydrogenase